MIVFVQAALAATAVILLDANYRERGCWIERPTELRGRSEVSAHIFGLPAFVAR